MTALHRFIRPRLTGWWDGDPAILERVFGVVALALGIFVMLPFPSSSPPFYILGRLIPEFLLGLILVSIGAWQVIFRRSDSLACNAVGAVSGAGVWFYLAFYTALDAWTAPVWVLYACFSAVWIVILFKMPLEPLDELMAFLSRFRATRWVVERLHDDSSDDSLKYLPTL